MDKITSGIIDDKGTHRPLQPGDSVMARMGKEGDVKTIWDRNNAAEVDNARRTFDDLRAKGYLAFRVTGKDGEKGEQMTTFDATAERMIMVPQMRGG